MFKLTEAAAKQIRAAASQGGTEGMALRFAARRIEDGSYDYVMGFDEATDDDISFKSVGIDIVMAPEYVPILDETTLDFVELEPNNPQFIFLNPKDPSFVPPAD